MPMQYVEVISKFEDFADDEVPYTYHCHMLHHEDDGMMGSFLVIDTTQTILQEINLDDITIFPNPVINTLFIKNDSNSEITDIQIVNSAGQIILQSDGKLAPEKGLSVNKLSKGIYFIRIFTNNNIVQQKFIKE